MSTNSKVGAYYVPDDHRKWWQSLSNMKFMRMLGNATRGRTVKVHSQHAYEAINSDMEYPVTEHAKKKHGWNGECQGCGQHLIDNTLVLTCSKCGKIL